MTMFRVYIDAGKKGDFQHFNDYRNFEQMSVWESHFDFRKNAYKAEAVCPECKKRMSFALERDVSECLNCGNYISLLDVKDEL